MKAVQMAPTEETRRGSSVGVAAVVVETNLRFVCLVVCDAVGTKVSEARVQEPWGAHVRAVLLTINVLLRAHCLPHA